MLTMTKTECARLNGAKSRGPVTPEGKARSARNALKHGRDAQSEPHSAVLVNENEARFDQLVKRRVRELQPSDSFEHDVVRELCSIEWRMERIQSIESHRLNQQCAAEADTLRRARGGLRGVQAVDLIANAYRSLEGAPQSPAACTREFARLQRCRRETLQTLLMLKKLRKNPAPVEEPMEIQPVDETPEPETNPPAKPQPEPIQIIEFTFGNHTETVTVYPPGEEPCAA